MKKHVPAVVAFSLLIPASATAVCTAAAGAPEIVILQGEVLTCRSAAPQLRAALELDRDAHEKWAQPLRNHLRNAGRLWVLRPYDELVDDQLSRLDSVIVTFRTDSQIEIRHDPAGSEQRSLILLDSPRTADYLLRIGSSVCDAMTNPPPAQIVAAPVCCDTPFPTSCRLHLPAATLPISQQPK